MFKAYVADDDDGDDGRAGDQRVVWAGRCGARISAK